MKTLTPILQYDAQQRRELDVTLRDDPESPHARLDFVRKSWDIERLTRPIDMPRRWSYVTDIRLRKDQLLWKQAKPRIVDGFRLFDGEVARQAIATRQEAEKDGRGVLDEFLLLCDAPNEAVLKYARTWGVLELCCHNLPSWHDFAPDGFLRLPDPLSLRRIAVRHRHSQDPRCCPPTGVEPLVTWRFFSAQARSILNIAADLQRARLGDEDDWARLLRDGVAPSPSLGAQRLCMRHAIESWLQLGRVKPTIDDLTIGLTWAGADLFGELAVQIALAAKALDGQVLCVACGKSYQPKRRVIRRGFNFCNARKCQREAAARRAKRYRDRKRSSQKAGKALKLPYRGLYQGRTNDPLFSG
jgi:hypothetical protein